jgi:hypothetical protein
MAQVARDRDRDRGGGAAASSSSANVRLVLMSPLAGSSGASGPIGLNLPRVLENHALLTSPIMHADGVAQSGPHYAISLLKGRRRRMEDHGWTATIELGTEQRKRSRRQPRRVRNNNDKRGARQSDVSGSTDITAGTASDSPAAAAAAAAPAAVPTVLEVDGDGSDDVDVADGGVTSHSTSDSDAAGEEEDRPANLFGIADGHGKSGALVAQLTAQLLPAMLQRNIRKAFAAPAVSPSSFSSVTPSKTSSAVVAAAVDSAVPASATPTAAASSSLLSPPRSSTAGTVAATPRSQRTTLHSPLPAHPGVAIGGSHMSPLQLQLPSPSYSPSSGLPPLHSTTSASTILPPVSAAAAVAASPSPTQGGPPGSEVADGPVDVLVPEVAAVADPVCRALTQTFLQLDAHVLAAKHVGGSTCTTAYVHQPPPVPASTTVAQDPATLYVAHVGDCLVFGTRVLLADGRTSCTVERVVEGMQLAGPVGPVQVTHALAGHADTTVRLSYGDGGSHSVTRNHLVTLRWAYNPQVKTRMVVQRGFSLAIVEAVWCDRSVRAHLTSPRAGLVKCSSIAH